MQEILKIHCSSLYAELFWMHCEKLILHSLQSVVSFLYAVSPLLIERIFYLLGWYSRFPLCLMELKDHFSVNCRSEWSHIIRAEYKILLTHFRHQQVCRLSHISLLYQTWQFSWIWFLVRSTFSLQIFFTQNCNFLSKRSTKFQK